jgi:hypothetical protein
MAEYGFLTTWLVAAPIDPVWEAIHDAGAWPRWWPAVTHVTDVDPSTPVGVGKEFAIGWRSLMGYELQFTIRVSRLERPYLLEGQATGHLTGHGRWRLFEAQGTTAVLYEWNVATTKRWMNLAAPIGRRFFRYNHDHVMRGGGDGLARLLGTRLLAQG